MTSPPMPTSQQTKEDTDEVHDHLERTFARIAHRVRECPEADFGGLHSMESARQLQDRDVRHTSGGLGRVYVFDHFLFTTRRGTPPTPWFWEIRRKSKPGDRSVSAGGFRSAKAAEEA